ncbi:MAG: type II/IV secretion system protein [Syntrophomonadaceae bacterium]|jgi:type IV pilus assembly protein PilB|nr:type II/IV secretion system protein [Syntrophomonadaceae bacterium]
MGKKTRLGDILAELNVFTEEQLNEALEEQQQTGEKLGRILVNRGIVTELQLIMALEHSLGIPHVQLSKVNIDPEAVKLVSPKMIRQFKVLPISCTNTTLTLAIVDPMDQQAMADVRMATGLDIIPVLAGDRDMDIAIRQYLAFRVDPNIDKILGELGQESQMEANERIQALVRVDDDAPIIRMVNSILNQAVNGRASDIHIEPQEHDLRIRFRIDGELFEVLSLPKKVQAAVISRLKIMSNMDIAEKRVSQDGRFRMDIDGHEIDFRVSTLPIAYGEKAVLRILDRSTNLTRIHQLGFTPRNMERVLALAQRPYGMVLVSGPTGSGKTTTLYAMLNEINSMEKNIITLEDPIEYSITGINQVQLNPKAGLTFASGLRSILRQDPDIIMVGEIRDLETANLAVQAALTGHLVLSTLHTNSAAGSIARLRDIGIEGFLLASSLIGVISQRLVRQLCPNCRQSFVLDEETAQRLDIIEETGQEFYHAVGCPLCRQLGYQGRVALQEVLIVGSGLRGMISRGEGSDDVFERAAVAESMLTIKADGMDKARQGITSLEEVMKVVLIGG